MYLSLCPLTSLPPTADLEDTELAGRNSTAAEVYGYPMGTWNVSLIFDFSALFLGYADFNEDISAWDTSSATTM